MYFINNYCVWRTGYKSPLCLFRTLIGSYLDSSQPLEKCNLSIKKEEKRKTLIISPILNYSRVKIIREHILKFYGSKLLSKVFFIFQITAAIAENEYFQPGREKNPDPVISFRCFVSEFIYKKIFK